MELTNRLLKLQVTKM